MADRPTVQADSDYNSARLGETTRYIAYGLVAAFYGIKIGGPPSLQSDSILVMVVGLAGVLSILLDYLQYLFGYIMAQATLSKAETVYHNGKASAWFAPKIIAFAAKQVCAVVGAIALVIIVLRA